MVGTIETPNTMSGSSCIKFSNGIIIECGNVAVSATTYSESAPFPYRGAVDVSVNSQFTTILTAIASPSQDDATWGNSAVAEIDNTNKTFRLTQGQNSSGTRNVNWLAIGLWK